MSQRSVLPPRGLLLLFGFIAAIAVAVPLTVWAPVSVAQPPYHSWQDYIDTPDGVRLHVDVLRPPGVADEVPTPVIMTVSPYRAHAAYLSQPRLEGGPSVENLTAEMFLDAGYTYAIVDLRGFGGSSGCPDFGGPGERSDVATAVEWAAAQPWSTGKVGLAGTSYEAWTGLMGLATQPEGLAAVAAFEPVVDPYSYLYMQGISWKFSGKPVTENGVRPADLAGLEHLLIASTPGHPTDSPEYHANALSLSLDCYTEYQAQITDHNGDTEFWRDRDLVRQVQGNTIPLFLGQGFLDYNTRAYRVFELWDAMGPGEHKAWFGQWGHRNCHEKCGTPHFDGELLAFFDRHVAERDVTVPGPAITVGQTDGRWRAETAWPPADAVTTSVELRTGTYTDRGLLPGPDRQIWSVSEPLPDGLHMAGIPRASLKLDGPPEAAVAVELYDIAPDGQALVMTRGIAPVADTAEVQLLAQDWPIAPGHRLGILITDVVDDVWSHTPSLARVTVTAATLQLPVLTDPRPADLPGGIPENLAKWRNEETVRLDSAMLNNAVVPVNLPTPMR